MSTGCSPRTSGSPVCEAGAVHRRRPRRLHRGTNHSTGRVDFSRKHAHYTGPLERAALRAALEAGHAALTAAAAERVSDPSWRLDFFGMPASLPHLLTKVIQHEAIHHGEWSVYASLAGFETPRLWKVNWGL